MSHNKTLPIADTPRFKSLLEILTGRLTRAFLNPPVLFEIRNIHTGETSPQFPPFSDGTLADRTARTLGKSWRVFRLTATPLEPSVPTTTLQDQATTTRELGALCNALHRATTVKTPAPQLPPNIHLEPGRLTVTFANAAELQESLESLARALAEHPNVFELDSTEASQKCRSVVPR
jgi:hypothetical protein